MIIFPVFIILNCELWESGFGCIRMESCINTASTEKVIVEVRVRIREETVVRENESLWRTELRLTFGVNEWVKRAVCPPQSG